MGIIKKFFLKVSDLLDGDLENTVDLHMLILFGTYLLTGIFCVWACYSSALLKIDDFLKVAVEAFIPTTITLMFSIVVENIAYTTKHNIRVSTFGIVILLFLAVYVFIYGVTFEKYSLSIIRNALLIILGSSLFIPSYLKLVKQMQEEELPQISRKG